MKAAQAASERQQHQAAQIASVAKKYICMSRKRLLCLAASRNSAGNDTMDRLVTNLVQYPIGLRCVMNVDAKHNTKAIPQTAQILLGCRQISTARSTRKFI